MVRSNCAPILAHCSWQIVFNSQAYKSPALHPWGIIILKFLLGFKPGDLFNSWVILAVYLKSFSCWNLHLLPRFSLLEDEIKFCCNTLCPGILFQSCCLQWCVMPQYCLQKSSSISRCSHLHTSMDMVLLGSYLKLSFSKHDKLYLLPKIYVFILSDQRILFQKSFDLS